MVVKKKSIGIKMCVLLLLLLLLLLNLFSFSTSFASNNLTMVELGNLIEKKYNVEFDETYSNSSLTNILNSEPLIISTWDNSKLYFFPTNGTLSSNSTLNSYMSNNCKMTIGNIGSSSSPTYIIGYSLSTTYANNFYYSISGGYVDLYMAIYDINNATWSYNSDPSYRYYGSSAGNGSKYFYNYGARGTTNSYPLVTFSNVSSSITIDEFKTNKYLKDYLLNNILFYGGDSIYYNSTDLLYKFDGVFTGNDIHEPYNSRFDTNIDMWRFDYFANTEEYKDLNYSNYFYLQEMSPSQAIQLTDEDIGPLNEETDLVTNFKFETNFNFTSLIKKMQQGYIYRLLAISNSSGDYGYRSSYATTQFFSLNSWKSNYITVLNIYDLVFPENPDIEQDGGTSGSVIDLENIENELGNLNNSVNDLNNNLTNVPNLSGEILTSGEIIGALDFEFAEDPYSNFWLELTTRFKWFFN